MLTAIRLLYDDNLLRSVIKLESLVVRMTPNAMVMTRQGSVTRIRELAYQLALCLKQASKIILVVLTLIHVKPSGSRHVPGGVLSSVFFDLHTKIKVLDGDVSANTKDFSHGFPPRF